MERRIVKHLGQRLANYGLWVKSNKLLVYINPVFWNIAIPIHLHILYGFFLAGNAELKGGDRDWMDCKI